MSSYDTLVQQCRSIIQDALESLDYDMVPFDVGPARGGHADMSSNVAFLLAKKMRQSPACMAEMVAGQCSVSGMVGVIESHPAGYVNITARWDILGQSILKECVNQDWDFGAKDTVTIEHTSVNPNKALHIGHVRNIVIGDVLARILRRVGHKVRVLNYVDDLGLQVAEAVLGFMHLGFDMNTPGDQKFDAYCGDVVYVEAARRCQDDAELQEVRSRILQDMERDYTPASHMAAEVTRKVLQAQLQTCWDMDIFYDLLNYESHIIESGLWGETFEKLKEMEITHLESDGDNKGCWVIGDKVIVRSNGTATYVAKDIPYAAWKMGAVQDPFSYVEYPGQPGGPLLQSALKDGMNADFGSHTVITVVDSRQARLQDMVTDIMARLAPSGSYVHLGYEAVTISPDTARILGIESEKNIQMSGRRGINVGADMVLDMLRRRAADETSKRNSDIDTNEVSRIIGVGTLRYEMIRQDLGRPITFDMDKSLRMEGDTASYILYSHARACRILEKSGTKPDYGGRLDVLVQDREKALLRLLSTYCVILNNAAENLAPKVVARYCYDMAVAFNMFYESTRVIGAKEYENARLCLVDAFCIVLRDALKTLGIGAPSRM